MSVGKRKLCLEADSHDNPKPSKLAKKRRTEECTEALGEQKTGTKVKRQVWTPTSIDAFFEGLCQHGKSFHGILHYMQAKFKKKNDPTIPNLTKDQVRFFYYRTWHKVSIMLGECSTDESNRKQLKLSCEETSPPPADRKFSEQEYVENQLDSSTEEGDGGELSPKASPTAPPEQNSPSHLQCHSVSFLEPSIGEKEKENAPNPTQATSTFSEDKLEVKKEMTKDTVMINGKSHSVDLVALICYHKLRKKCPEQVIGRKLRELVYQGYTTIREKGKRKLQVKIPNCRALRGTMHSIDIPPPADGTYSEPEPLTPSEDTRHIVIELRPRSVSSWLYVQGLAQNPRVRLIVAAFKRIAEILHYLALKWHLLPSKEADLIQLYHTYNVEPVVSGGLVNCALPITCQRLHHESNVGQGTMLENKDGTSTLQGAVSAPGVCAPKDPVDGLGLIPLPGPAADLGCSGPAVSEATLLPPPPPLSPHSSALQNLSSAKDAMYKPIDALNECTVEDLHQKFLKPMKLQLFYEFPTKEIPREMETACGSKLATLCRMVEFIGHYEETRMATSMITPVSTDGKVQSSPKHIGYVKLLPKRSPWKSPLSKYQRMKSASPLKQMSVRRTRLNFSLAPSTSGAESSLAMPSREKVDPFLPPALSTPVSASYTSCATEPQKADLQVTNNIPLYNCAEGFSNIKLNNAATLSVLGPTVKDGPAKSGTLTGSFRSLDTIVSQSHCTSEEQEMGRSPTAAPQNSPGTARTSTTPSYHINLSGQSRVIVSPLTVSSPKGPLSLDGGSSSTKPSTSTVAQPLNRFSEAAISQSPLLQFASSSLGTSFAEKNIANVTTISSHQMPIVTPLKPFSKSKRVKKAPGKSVQTRQLVPRPLSFQSTAPLTGAQTQQPVVVADAIPPANPPKSSQTSNSVLMSNVNSPNVSQVLSLLQSLLQQQMQSTGLSSNQSLPAELPKQQPTTKELSSKDPVTPAITHQENQVKDLGTIEKFPSPMDASSTSEMLNSSDTVNELLRGLCSHPSENSLQKLSEETADVLPNFAKAVISLESTPPAATNLVEDFSLGGIMDQGELLQLAGVFSQFKEAFQTPEKAKQHNSDGDISMSEILNFADLAPERKSENSLLSSGDSTYRSLLDDSSVDYIQKFRELASKMNQSS